MTEISTLKPETAIKAASVVRLRSGGQTMTVCKIIPANKEHEYRLAACYWFDNMGKMWSWNLPIHILELVDEGL